MADVSKSIAILERGMEVQAMTVDANGNVYLAGISTVGFAGATTKIGPGQDQDIFVIKTNATADQILYATSIGGGDVESVRGIAVDTSGNLYLAGSTVSRDFPFTYKTNSALPIGAMALKLNAAGNALTYAAQLGNTMTVLGIDIDSTGAAYVVGSGNAQDLATTAGVLKPAPGAGANPGDYMGFIMKVAPSGSGLQAATYYGAANKSVEAIAVKPAGLVILADGTLATINTGLTQQTASATIGMTGARMAFDTAGNVHLAGTSNGVAGGFVLRRYAASGLALNLDKTYPFVTDKAVPRIAVTPAGRIFLFGQPGAASFATLNGSQPCLANIAAPNGAAGLPTIDTSGGLVGTVGAPLPPEQALVVLDPAGTILHSSFTPMLVSQTATASSTGRIYLAVTETIFTTPRTTWSGIVRLNPDLIPTDKASPSCVVHAASFNPVRMSPGALMSIFGSNLGPVTGEIFKLSGAGNTVETTLGGTSVTVDGKAAPLLFTRRDQINLITPWTIRTDGAAIPVCVTFGGNTTCVQVGTTRAVTGAFQRGAVTAALNQNNSIHETTNPAAPGEVVQLFMTGFGAIDGNMVDGGVATSGAVRGTVTASTEPPPTGGCGLFACAASGGPKNVPVGYAGVAPSLVLGVDQVNIYVPTDMPSGLQTFTINFKPTGSTDTISTNVQLQIK